MLATFWLLVGDKTRPSSEQKSDVQVNIDVYVTNRGIMPALVLFGRRWLVAGDDLPAPALLLAIFHLVCTTMEANNRQLDRNVCRLLKFYI